MPLHSIIAAHLRLGPGPEMARPCSPCLGETTELLGLFRFGAWTGDDQPSLRSVMHRELFSTRFQLRGHWLLGRNAGRREKVRRTLRRSAAVDRERDDESP